MKDGGGPHLHDLEGVHGGGEDGHLVHLALPCAALLVAHEAIVHSLDGGPCILGIRLCQRVWLRDCNSCTSSEVSQLVSQDC